MVLNCMMYFDILSHSIIRQCLISYSIIQYLALCYRDIMHPRRWFCTISHNAMQYFNTCPVWTDIASCGTISLCCIIPERMNHSQQKISHPVEHLNRGTFNQSGVSHQ